MNVLAISGSLRQASLNTKLLQYAAAHSPANIRITVFDGLKDLPLFNPDISELLATVDKLYQAIIQNDTVLIASPEYAHGITGVMKNALDWMVGNDSFVNKPVILWNASPRAHHAHDAMLEILHTMSAHINHNAHEQFPILGHEFEQPFSEELCVQIHHALATMKLAL
jgi:chromate reductase